MGAFDDDVKWEAESFKLDRFGITVMEVSCSSKLAAATTKLFSNGNNSSSPLHKSSNLCQVDNCTVDVSKMKDYHTRYKICEFHLKARLVTKDGRDQRFCQQCGKFHNIDEFDGEKRSCRARLDKHNTRRRRQREMAQMLRTTGRIDEAALRLKYGLTEEELLPKVQKLQRRLQSSSAGGNPEPSRDDATATSAQSQSTATEAGSTQPAMGTSDSVFPAGYLPSMSPADLDLLGDGYLENVLGPMAAAAGVCGIQRMPSLGMGASDMFMAMDPAPLMNMDDISVLEGLTREVGMEPNTAAIMAAGGAMSSCGGGSYGGDSFAAMTLSPLRQAQAAVAFPFNTSSFDSSVSMSTAAPPGLQAAAATAAANGPSQLPPACAMRIFTSGGMGLGGLPPYMQPSPDLGSGVPLSDNSVLAPPRHSGTGNSLEVTPSLMEDVMASMAYDPCHVHYTGEERLVRLSVKMFGCNPTDLPGDIKSSLSDMLITQTGGMEGYMRPGCVHIQVNALANVEVRAALEQGGMHAAVERFLAACPESATSAPTVVLQLGNKLAMVREGKLVHVVDTSGAASLLPAVAAVRPTAVVAPPRGGTVELTLWGFNLGREGDVILARSKGQYLDAEILGVEDNAEEWGEMQRMTVRVKGALTPGSLQLEVLRGAYASAARSTLVAPSAEAAAEAATLAATPDAGEVDTLIYELGAVLEATHGSTTTNRRSFAAMAAAPSPPAKAARRLLPFLIQRKWPVLLQVALDAVTCDGVCAAAVAAEADVLSVGSTGMSLLQLAVRTQSPEMLGLLLQWARANGHEFKSTTSGRRGVAALHLAALVRDGGIIAALLTAACPDALDGWEGARADDGSTPMGLATRMGTAADIERCIAQAQYACLANSAPGSAFAKAAVPFEIAPDTTFSSSEGLLHQRCGAGDSSGKSGIPLERLPSEMDDVALSKAAHRGASLALESTPSALLTFKSGDLETKYADWYNAGQVPVDVTFMLIAILSQVAWLMRWQPTTSIWLVGVMSALIIFNLGYVATAILRPAVYVRRREWLCVATLVLHKLAQMAITVAPEGGTIYSSTYSATVAVLESSSFAQIAMLSFGAKARVVYHLPTLLLMLGLSATVNGAICQAAFPYRALLPCSLDMLAFETVACFMVPAAAVYLCERRSRRIFLETAVA